jgi:hypothetical protein
MNGRALISPGSIIVAAVNLRAPANYTHECCSNALRVVKSYGQAFEHANESGVQSGCRIIGHFNATPTY